MTTRSGDPYERAREGMVATQIAGRGVRDEAVLNAMRRVPRHRFVAPEDQWQAYDDHPIPIGYGQTISQPFMVALMVELCALRPSERALEVGSGSGYQAAVLAQLCQHVYAVDLVPQLVERAAATLRDCGIHNVTLSHRDGSLGWPEHAPYDAIIVAAGAPAVPTPLVEQLSDGGRLVIPVGPMRGIQQLQVFRRRGDELTCTESTPCRFVDLQGRYGWHDEPYRF